jgi:hypothetical protein
MIYLHNKSINLSDVSRRRCGCSPDCSGWGETIKDNVNRRHPRAEVASRRRCAHHKRDDDSQTIGNADSKEGCQMVFS